MKNVFKMFKGQSLQVLPQNIMKYKLTRVIPSDYPEVLNLFWSSFVPFEPVHKAMGLSTYDPILEERLKNCLAEGLSLAVKRRYDDEILGVAVNTCLNPWAIDDLKEKARKYSAKGVSNLFQILVYILRHSHIFDEYPNSKIYEVTYLMISKSDRYKGIGEMLVKSSHADSRDLGFDIFRMNCTHEAATRICKKLNYQLYWKMPFEDYTDKNGKRILTPTVNGKKISVFIDYLKTLKDNLVLNEFG